MPSARSSSEPGDQVATTNAEYAAALARAVAGAGIFSLPLLMTMEMWWFGFTLGGWMLVQLSLVHLLVLVGLSRVAGFEESHSRIDDLLDAFSAYGVAALVSAALLLLFGVIGPGMPLREMAGKVLVQVIPASFGAMIGAKLLGGGAEIEAREHWRDTYPGRLFLMLAGALFLSFTMAPTEEMILIAQQVTPWHALAIVAASILGLHLLVYRCGLGRGERRHRPDGPLNFVRFTLPGYGIVVLASLYILWSYGRLAGIDPAQAAIVVAVLGLPAAIGAGIARVVI